MVHIEPPLKYVHWSGKIKTHPEQEELESLWVRNPTMQVIYNRDLGDELAIDHTVVTVPEDNDGWVHIGFAPRPKNKWQRFWADYHHGRLMRYPWFSVLMFSIMGLRR